MKQLSIIECIRLFKNKTSRISLCFLILWTIVIIASSILQESIIYDMNSKRLHGMDAIALEKEIFLRDEIIIEEDITKLIAPYQEVGNRNITQEEANQIVFSKALFPYQQLANFLNTVYAPLDDPNTNTAIFSIDKTTNFYTDYKARVIEELTKQDTLSSQNIESLQAIQPFSYAYAKGWETLFHKLPELILGILICLTLSFANIFSENHEVKTSDIIHLTRNGKTKLVKSKYMAVFLYATLLYVTFVAIFIGIVLCIFASGGAHTSVQILLDAFYPQNMSMLQAVIKLVVLGYCSVLTTSALLLFVSSLYKSAFRTTIFSILLIFVPFYMSALSSPSLLLRCIPINFIDKTNVFNTNFIPIFGINISVPLLLFCETILLLLSTSIFVLWKEKHNRS